jgi:hypothetical protein
MGVIVAMKVKLLWQRLYDAMLVLLRCSYTVMGVTTMVLDGVVLVVVEIGNQIVTVNIRAMTRHELACEYASGSGCLHIYE